VSHTLASPCGCLERGALRKIYIKPLVAMVEEWHRLAALVAGPPGSGKTMFLKALRRVPEWLGVEYVYLAAKEVSIPVRCEMRRCSATLWRCSSPQPPSP